MEHPIFEGARLVTSADGTRIYTDAAGNPSKPSIVFIHGYSLSSIVYDNLFSNPSWREKLFLVRLDMRGHGKSDKPEQESAWTQTKFAEDFDAVVRAYQLRKPLVAAWSCGGAMVADILAFHSSISLAGIVYITPIPYLGFFQHIATDYVLDVIPKLTQKTDVNTFQIASRDFIQGLVSPKHYLNRVAFPQRLQQACLGDVMSQPRTCAAYTLQRSQDEFGLMRAGREGLPMLLINGKDDMLLKSQPLSKLFEKWKNMEVVNMDTGHMPWWEAPQAFNDVVLGWIAKVLGGEMKRMQLEAHL
ncbi:hypothetical protein SERLA73DRAFT_169392 [Serpula lacrymans var. lacrymans S7.3]|uniref:AB hydrolase-1 domain-containing protein n=2 Tax=Serpula lacrymans var. lacrymans TaxID=341189 RepID=F8PZV2_SERL3|nr:uncharacterized protein SERLADRAFT_450300 [Serpula lacrymans var. lacrymans S7.9]EGN98424.1 hypothetical protein SERLA73DRAFT_169392 [Serpula lacrymans var. lacrymans S7.3]EGO24006.1 hypothetical protein SERLADRAFT_450300 [Serpula lacrymans var. lacrymans S7.9]